ncbi:MAG: dolichyl-phosphate beta-glucosyltransferase [Lichina confinis]|nr:MAG: dolichyl-phosphate beta-glucosyltransferase [Lichina confinis]
MAIPLAMGSDLNALAANCGGARLQRDSALVLAVSFYLALRFIAPIPRAPRSSERVYQTVSPDGSIPKSPQHLPCWHDDFVTRDKTDGGRAWEIDAPQVLLSLVVPAYNEEQRLPSMLDEAVAYLEREHAGGGGKAGSGSTRSSESTNGSAVRRKPPKKPRGWEILVVSDGSTDATAEIALRHARAHGVGRPDSSGSMRVVSLERNRGKGGAVTHGMRHVRGQYVLFADADGASTFSDLDKLMQACRFIVDDRGRAIAIGSRAHLVGSEVVVKRSLLRNLLMHSFHLFLRLLTPPATAKIKDTQCGFKLFSRPSLPYIIPYMHSEGWIFDVEMLMLAEAAGIPVAEVAVGWKEVKGSKLNVVWDSLGMAWGLAVLRAAWALGVYKRR